MEPAIKKKKLSLDVVPSVSNFEEMSVTQNPFEYAFLILLCVFVIYYNFRSFVFQLNEKPDRVSVTWSDKLRKNIKYMNLYLLDVTGKSVESSCFDDAADMVFTEISKVETVSFLE